MGVSLLGLDRDERWLRHNKLGIDLSRRGVRFGRGISKRRGRDGIVRFIEASGEEVLDSLKDYKGGVALAMIQFPTPYAYGLGSSGGNSQLPQEEDDGFMVTKGLARGVKEVGAEHVLIQSNVEDVALRCCEIFEGDGYAKVANGEEDKLFEGGDDRALNDIAKEERVTERGRRWLEGGGGEGVVMERADEAAGWRGTTDRFFGCKGVTETEVNCVMSGTGVFRVLLRRK
jgi:hypothetical protein